MLEKKAEMAQNADGEYQPESDGHEGGDAVGVKGGPKYGFLILKNGSDSTSVDNRRLRCNRRP